MHDIAATERQTQNCNKRYSHHGKTLAAPPAKGKCKSDVFGYYGAMQIYLVGGAVRDRKLGLAPGEKDWCVVGSTPDELRAAGYRQVGKDFPVFLHPDTGEEYALARTERKTAPGYHGFLFDFSPDVSIEDDLRRRDLTINAMALDADGNLIDPYGGSRDIESRCLRHVSEAFAGGSGAHTACRPIRGTLRRVSFQDC